MTNTNITSFRDHIFEYVEQAVVYGDVVNVSTKHGNAVVISEDDYRNMLETLHLSSIPGMAESIRAAAQEPIEDCAPYDPAEPW